MIDVLIPIWQRVFQRSSIGIEDNFFDLGGNPSLAVQLFSEIALLTGRVLPPETIYQAPSIATLARALESSTPPPLQALALLKAGTQTPPIFIAPGMGGSVMEFFELVKFVHTGRPIYGLQAKGNNRDGREEPFERIEDMAQHHLDAIKEVQPRGPYSLIGYSLGGLVTLEIAQRLLSGGEVMALLAMLDSYPHPKYLPFGQRIRLSSRRRTNSVVAAMKLHFNRIHRSNKPLRIPTDPKVSAAYHPVPAISAIRQRAFENGYLALERYQPGFYAGKIHFVKAEVFSFLPDDPLAVWGKLAYEIEVQAVPGNHHEILSTNFKALGLILSTYLSEANSAQNSKRSKKSVEVPFHSSST